MRKQTSRSATAQPTNPVVLFGIDETGKPKGAKFSDRHAELAIKAASQLDLKVLTINDPKLVDLAARVPAGRIYATGRGFIPSIRRDLYAKLIEAAGPATAADQASGTDETAGANKPGQPGSPSGKPPRLLPQDWDEIGPGHVVVALEEPGEGWYEANVIERHGDMLTLKYRDYPTTRRFTEHRLSVALMYSVDPPGEAKSAKSKGPSGSAAHSNPEAFPKTWADIAVDSLVLAKDDGPWRAWWEAIPVAQTDDVFTLRWRDFPQVPNVARPRGSLALLYPNPKK